MMGVNLRAPRSWRSWILGLLVAALVAASWGGPVSAQAKDDLTIGLSLPSLSFAWFVFLQNAVEERAEQLGVKVIAVDAQDDVAKQMSDVEDLIVRGVDGVLLVPIDAQALIPAVEELNSHNIPVVTVDRMVTGGKVLAHVGADNVEGGRQAGRYVAWALGGQGKVVELEGTPGSSPARDRGRGFNEVIGNYPGIEVVARQTANFRRADGLTVMENILQVHRDIAAVFAHNDEMALGAMEALMAAGLADQVLVVGFDAIEDALSAVADGTMAATIEQFPGGQAQKGIDVLVEYLRTGNAPSQAEIYLTPEVITRGNLQQAEKGF